MAADMQDVLWYKHHWEANYVLEGQGEVVDLTTEGSWAVRPGMMYMVGPEDRHSMRAHSALHLLSVFNPPLEGDEVHNEEGTLPPTDPLPPGPGHA